MAVEDSPAVDLGAVEVVVSDSLHAASSHDQISILMRSKFLDALEHPVAVRFLEADLHVVPR